MHKLYRIVDAETWENAQSTGVIPRCDSDERENLVHLNVFEDVAAVTAVYFQPSDRPLALEIDVREFEDQIFWLPPTDEKPWKQPCARIQNICVDSVIERHELKSSMIDGKVVYCFV